MKAVLNRHPWSPYAVGAGIGVLSWITFLVMHKALGASTTMVRAVGLVEGSISESHVRETPYLAKYMVGHPAIDWQFALVVFLVVGGFLAARLAGTPKESYVPPTWARSFGPSRKVRTVGAFLGGALLLYGARLAGGCTSGHAISGGLQLAVSSWTFLAAMFLTGIVTAKLLYRKEA
ncbi:MAG: YeeE/YedE thiosulfate transporter family protein [Planctomycetota bacterium]